MSGSLTEEEVRDALDAPDLHGWHNEDGKIVRHYRFPTFMEAIAFINRLAEKAEEANHHPHLFNHFHQVQVALHTLSEGVTHKDLALAREIESVALLD